MPVKNIYVKEDDLPVWNRAKELANGSLSHLLTEALKAYIEDDKRERVLRFAKILREGERRC